MSRILLTGGMGYIGTHTAVALVDAGHSVILYDNLSNSKFSVLDRLELIIAKKLPFIHGDIRNESLLKETLYIYQIDTVIHLAGLKSVSDSNKWPVEYYHNNVMGTICLLKAMSEMNVKRLVFSSSATVYGEPEYLPIDEAHPTCAINPYGRTKLHIEEILVDLVQSQKISTDKPWKIACLRYFNPVGAHESKMIGEDGQGTPNNLMPLIAQVAVGLRSELNVFGDNYDTPDGSGIRDYIHVMDLAEGHSATVDFLDEAQGWNVINLGTGVGLSVFEIVNMFQKESGREIPYRILQRRLGDTACCYASVDKAKSLLNWQPTRTVGDMCRSTWMYQKNIHLKNKGI